MRGNQPGGDEQRGEQEGEAKEHLGNGHRREPPEPDYTGHYGFIKGGLDVYAGFPANYGSMNVNIIQHPPRHFRNTLTRRLEIERDCPECPDGIPGASAKCPDCGCTMVYRGLGRLRSGTSVHYFECVHSHREVHSVSIVITD